MTVIVLCSILAIATCCFAAEAAGKSSCENIYSPFYVKLGCIILPRSSGSCYIDNSSPDGAVSNACDDSAPCRVSTGMQLQISCGESSNNESSLDIYRNGSLQEAHNISWKFAVASEIEGLYECRRRDDGSLVSKRSIIFDNGLYVIPGSAPYDQYCRMDIAPVYAPGYTCNIAYAPTRYIGGGNHIVKFNILGVRPIDVSIDVIWVNHYPVDLHLLYDSQVNDSTTLHSVKMNLDDLRIIEGTNFVNLYLVITANNNNDNVSTLCQSIQIIGYPTLFINESLPQDQTVFAGKEAVFSCLVQTSQPSAIETATVAFLVRAPESRDLMECLNCSFSATELSFCSEMVNEGTTCSGLEFANSSSSSGGDGLLIHNLTAQWYQVEIQLIGYEVVCAIAVDGVTQWANTATLTVLPTPSTTPHNDKTYNTPLIVVSAIVVVIVVIAAISTVTLAICRLQRYRQKLKNKWPKASTKDDANDNILVENDNNSL